MTATGRGKRSSSLPLGDASASVASVCSSSKVRGAGTAGHAAFALAQSEAAPGAATSCLARARRTPFMMSARRTPFMMSETAAIHENPPDELVAASSWRPFSDDAIKIPLGLSERGALLYRGRAENRQPGIDLSSTGRLPLRPTPRRAHTGTAAGSAQRNTLPIAGADGRQSGTSASGQEGREAEANAAQAEELKEGGCDRGTGGRSGRRTERKRPQQQADAGVPTQRGRTWRL